VTLVRGEGRGFTIWTGMNTPISWANTPPGCTAILAAIREALEGGLVLGGPNTYEARFAELMCARFPAVERVRFCNSGTEANLMNLCLSRAVTGRPAMLAFNGGYHGGVLAFAGGGSPINAPFEAVLATYNPIDNPDDVAQFPNAARKLLHLDMMLRDFYIARRGFLALYLPLTETEYSASCDAFDAFLGENAAVLIETIHAHLQA
jgi:hypothetical protein